MLALFTLAVLARMPALAWPGRFYGEEGAFFLAYAWHMPWRDALLHPLGGYLNIVPSATTLLAKDLVQAGWVGLGDAPYLTEGVALAFQLCPAILLLAGRPKWLAPPWALICALTMLAAAPRTEEVWLHTLHSQFHLALCAGIILASETAGGRLLKAFRLALLLLGPLCGPGAIVFAPFFAVRVALERNGARALQLAALLLGAAIQLGLFYAASKSRSLHIEPSVLASVIFLRQIVMPLVGPGVAGSLGADWHAVFVAGATPWAAVLASVATLGALSLAALARWRETPAWLLLPGLSLAAVSYVGALRSGPLLLDVDFATRYSFVPQALIGLALLALATSGRGRLSTAAGALAVWVAMVGAVWFLRPIESLATGADWRAEAAAWRLDPNHRLATWPKRWLVDLSPTDAKCSPDPDAPNPPDFCDQYWERM